MPVDHVRCTRHPGVRAAWRCRGCGAALCPGCAYVHRTQGADLLSCVRCRGLAEPITVHRRALRSFAARLPGALVWPLRPGPLLAVLGAGAVFALFSYGGFIGGIVSFAVRWTFLFSVIRQGALGRRSYEAAELTDEGHDLVFPAVRGLVGMTIVWLPAAAWFAWRFGQTRDLAAAATDPVMWLLLAAGVAYAPAALMHAAAGGRAVEMLNPIFPVSFMARLGKDYALAVVAIVFLGAVGTGLWFASLMAGALPVPFLSRVLAHSVDLLAPTAMARVLGVLLYVRGDDLDYGVPADYQEPVLPGAVPRGSEPVLATTAAAPEPAAAAEPAAPAPADPADPAVPAEPAEPTGEIVAAVGAGDPARAADLFESYRGPPGALPPRVLFAVAKAAADAGRHALSARALHAAGTGDDVQVAPNALLVLARVYERRLGRAAEGRKVLEYLVQRWPSSEAATQARAALSPPAEG